jgi:predicted acyltransferase (DUF342 family)
MTPLESWIVSNSLPIAAYIVLGLLVFAKLGGIKENKESLERHKSNTDPHTACPAHAQMIRDMKDTLSDMVIKVNTMDSRIYEIWKNGRNK